MDACSTQNEHHDEARKASSIQEQPARDKSVVAHLYQRDPNNYGEAIRSSERKGLGKAMREELEALEENGVWHLTKRQPSNNAIHTKWVYKMKTDAHSDLERLKARLVAYGNEQGFGIDYQLTFPAVMEMSTVKVILALAATWGVSAKHGDIPNAYVKADKESHLEILLQVPQAMNVNKATLKKLGASSKK